MKSHNKEIFGSLAAAIMVLAAYLYSYGRFEAYHSHFYFESGEDILLVPDTAANRSLAILFAPISYAVRTPIDFAPKVAASPKPARALPRTRSGDEVAPAARP